MNASRIRIDAAVIKAGYRFKRLGQFEFDPPVGEPKVRSVAFRLSSRGAVSRFDLDDRFLAA
jgi:hypothetical protein